MTEDAQKDHVEALLRERAQYERQGLTSRVDLVDKELGAFGYEAPKPKRTTKRTSPKAETR